MVLTPTSLDNTSDILFLLYATPHCTQPVYLLALLIHISRRLRLLAIFALWHHMSKLMVSQGSFFHNLAPYFTYQSTV